MSHPEEAEGWWLKVSLFTDNVKILQEGFELEVTL